MGSAASVRAEADSRVRHVVLASTLLLAGIVYLDRVCISTAAFAIRADLGLSDIQMGWVFSSFTIAYAIFEVPSGFLADRFGARLTLARIVVAWSILTAATGATTGFHSLLIVRFLFGAGEAGAFPSIARAYGRWLPAQQRGRAFGMAVMAGLVGAAVGQPLTVALMRVVSWRWVFPAFGALGLVWAAAWYAWFRDDPHRHPAVNAGELRVIGHAPEAPHGPVPWRRLLGSRSLAALCLMYMGAIYGWYFYLTWLPQYLLRARGFDLKQVGWLSALPLLGIAAGVLAGGVASDALTVRVGPRHGRRIPGLVGLPLAAGAILVAVKAPSPMTAALALSAAAALAALGVAPAWATCVEIGGGNAGVASGAMNTFGNLGGALSPLVVGYCLERWQAWDAPLVTVAVLYAFAALCWSQVDPDRDRAAAR
jgi:MFS family permease